MWPPLQGPARKGGMVPAFKDPQRDAWPSGLWAILKVENDKVKTLQKHPEGKKNEALKSKGNPALNLGTLNYKIW